MCVCLRVSAALGIQHGERMCHILIRGLSASTIHTLFNFPHDFWGKGTEHKPRVLIFTTNLSEIFLILSRIRRDIIINVKRA